MYVKMYAAVCVLFAAISAVVFVAGMMTPMAAVWFGFIAFGVVFMGMISVLPSTISVHAPLPRAARVPAKTFDNVVAGTSDAIRKIGADIAAAGQVETPGLKLP
ncbi:MAG: hypothetical protein IT173_04940 [Acidobacteria bacterium]|nr:hypothetical protein [Acidobacteriota bacterium]